jgi:WS/DGAT/MGAT family acyltransferase
VALVQKTHHALADGVSGVDAATVMLDLSPSPPATASLPWTPQRRPGVLDALGDMTSRGLRAPSVAARAAMSTLRTLRHPAAGAGSVVAVAGVGHGGPLAPHTSINRPIGDTRRLAVVRADLGRMKEAAHAHGAKVNDVALAVVTAGLRSLLEGRGEGTDGVTLRALVPVSLRPPDRVITLGNRVGALVVPLPVGEPDPIARVRIIAATTAELKRRDEAHASELLLAAADHIPGALLPPVAHLIDRQPLVNLVVTNVPGPPVPLYLLGAEMVEAFPVLPLAGNLTVGVAILSYNGQLNFGIRADVDTCPDVDVLADGMARELAVLTAAVGPPVALAPAPG